MNLTVDMIKNKKIKKIEKINMWYFCSYTNL